VCYGLLVVICSDRVDLLVVFVVVWEYLVVIGLVDVEVVSVSVCIGEGFDGLWLFCLIVLWMRLVLLCCGWCCLLWLSRCVR